MLEAVAVGGVDCVEKAEKCGYNAIYPYAKREDNRRNLYTQITFTYPSILSYKHVHISMWKTQFKIVLSCFVIVSTAAATSLLFLILASILSTACMTVV